jgi:hypothetical protein
VLILLLLLPPCSLQTMYFGPASCYLLGPAFPNLRTLELWGVELGQGGALASLQICTQLLHVSLGCSRSCTIIMRQLLQGWLRS